jgi:hypothetical protein
MPDKEANVIYDMLCENTGIHPGDSGKEADRAWQINQTRDIRKEPYVKLEYFENNGKAEVIPTVSTYHFLNDCVGEHVPKLDLILYYFANQSKNKDKDWPTVLKDFPKFMLKHCPKLNRKLKIFGERTDTGVCHYSYNNASRLSQDIYFLYFEFDFEEYAIIGTHNGSDARCGFSTPRSFELTRKAEYSIFEYDNIVLSCQNSLKSHCWDYLGGAFISNTPAIKHLGAWPIVFETTNEEIPPKTLFVKKDGTGLCPLCQLTLKACVYL